MIDFNFDKDCCGCSSCANSCPVNAISMKPNPEGFLVPIVDKQLCIECGKCEKACPHISIKTDVSSYCLDCFKDKPAYLYYFEDPAREDSASGGFVYAAMRQCIDRGGVVSGCIWDENFKAIHVVTDKVEDLPKLQSSKYVQSEIGRTYSEIKSALIKGRDVVFCGTPCQTAGLRTFLGKTNTSKLISICVICHGVPSPLVWKRWKECLEEKYHGSLTYINMRDKHEKGYATTCCKYIFRCASKEKTLIRPAYLADPYVFLFSDSLYLRKSCYHCQYKADYNGADIIAGDFHASIKEAGRWGCSSLFAMTEKGRTFIETLPGYCKNGDSLKMASVNPMLWKSEREHSMRNDFFKRIENGAKASDFTHYLPHKFYIKGLLSKLGVFNLIRATLKK